MLMQRQQHQSQAGKSAESESYKEIDMLDSILRRRCLTTPCELLPAQ
jgi:hypothetical protein